MTAAPADPCVILSDLELQVTYFDPGAEAALEMTELEARNRLFSELVCARPFSASLLEVLQQLRNEPLNEWSGFLPAYTGQGTLVELEVTLKALRDEGGYVNGFMAFVRRLPAGGE